MAQIQLPNMPFVRANEATQQGIAGLQNAMLQQSQLKNQALLQQRVALENQQTQEAMQKRQELETLLRNTPPERQWTVTRDWAAVNNPDMAFKMDQLGFEAAMNQYKALSGTPGRTPVQAGVEAQLPANASSPVVPLEQQQVAHAPIEFPGTAGRPGFSATPQTQQQVQDAAARQLGLSEGIKARAYQVKMQPGITSRENIATLGRTAAAELAEKQRASMEKIAAAHDAARLKAAALHPSGGVERSDIAAIGDAIITGKQPPDMSRMYGKSAALRGYLAKKGYDLTSAERDWKAINRHIATLNGPQQERLRQAINFVDETTPQLEAAYNEWKKQAGVSGVRLFNKLNLAASKNLPGAAGSAANQLEALIADYTSELGTVYKGGNSSTDESLKLAAQNISGDWNEQTFNDAIKRIRETIKIRRNSINTSEAVGVSPNSPYNPPMGGGGKSDPLGLFK